jgi:subtilisin family serine protease
MADYPHLKLPYKIEGLAKPPGGGSKPLFPQTGINKNNRQGHGKKLIDQIENLRTTWDEFRRFKGQGESSLPNEIDIPIFIKIDPNSFPKVDTFRHWGVQIISEEEDGFLIGVTQDGFRTFEENLTQFLNEKGRYKDTAAKIWEIGDNNARILRLLKGDLKEVWGHLEDEDVYTVELGVHCYIYNLLDYPERQNFDDQTEYDRKLEEYKQNERDILIRRDEIQIQREEEIGKYIADYKGVVQDEWDNETDAIFFKLSISGKGLRDLVFTYQYLFKIAFPAKFQIEKEPITFPGETEAEIIAPDDNTAAICIIDSGIQQNHRLIAPAINAGESFSYVHGDPDVSDFVKLSGHGTKVAGASLYPREVPTNGTHKLICRLQNARILDKDNEISDQEFSPVLMNKIVTRYSNTRIFNLSVAEKRGYTGSHMHELAESIDKLMHEKNILFIIATGNLYESTGSVVNPGVNDFIQQGLAYPDYLKEGHCRIANPGISSFALTVGSVGYLNYEDDDFKSVAGRDYVSPFSRTGLGMWGAIKPDVVEYGGDLTVNKNSGMIAQHPATSIELVNSTRFNAAAHGKESYGTSYSAPKVSHIVANLQNEHPNESAQMYRALVVQSARLPAHCFYNPTTDDFTKYGYGIPDLARALNNALNRVTFIQQGSIGGKKADIYKLIIPSELRGENAGFQILVEITLAFTARTRATRKGAHSYMSTWLEWKSCRYSENFNSFRARTLQYLEEEDQEMEAGDDAIQWVIRENPRWSDVKINRNYSSIQKSWAIIQPHQFGGDFSIAIIGHAGWDKNLENAVPYALTVSFESVGVELPIYELMSKAQVPEFEAEAEIEV